MFVLYIGRPTCRSSFAVPHLLFSEVPSCRAVQVYCSDYFLNDSETVGITSVFTSISTGITFVLFVLIFHLCLGLYVLKYFWLSSWSDFYLLKLQCLLPSMLLLITTHFDVWLIVRDSSVSFRLLVSQSDGLTTYYRLLLLIAFVPLSPVTEWTSLFTLQFIAKVTRIFNLFDVHSV